jgi:predicted enzyme related to lactoylglutathione lyase
MSNQICWVDIPVTDLDRAIKFYSSVIGQNITKETMPGFNFGLLPHTENSVSGCLYVPEDDNKPSATGALVYLNVEGRLAQAVKAISAAGGKVLQDVHPIGPYGFRAIFRDTEGNRVALHAMTNS